ncbi:hypothetical protein BGZ90_011927 [Linnemannia elongata]|nr:hypothetical protein BGZ90_011927 [Linnemannia elongata]
MNRQPPTTTNALRRSISGELARRRIISNTPPLDLDPTTTTTNPTVNPTATDSPSSSGGGDTTTSSKDIGPKPTPNTVTSTTTTTGSGGRPTNSSGATPLLPATSPLTSGGVWSSTSVQATAPSGSVGSTLPGSPGSRTDPSGWDFAAPVTVIIGSIVGSFMIVVVMLMFGFVLYKRRQHQKGDEEKPTSENGEEAYEVKGTPPSSPRLEPHGVQQSKNPQLVPIGMEHLMSQTITLTGDGEEDQKWYMTTGDSSGQRNPQDHERRDQLDRVVKLHREQLQQLHDLLRLHQSDNPRPFSAPHTLTDDGEGKEEGRPLWQISLSSLYNRRGHPQGDGDTVTPPPESRSTSRTGTRSESSLSMTVTAVDSEVEYDYEGKIQVLDGEVPTDLMRSFAEINARYDLQIQRIHKELE